MIWVFEGTLRKNLKSSGLGTPWSYNDEFTVTGVLEILTAPTPKASRLMEGVENWQVNQQIKSAHSGDNMNSKNHDKLKLLAL